MSRTQEEPHKVKIQQTYWAKDTVEEKMTEMGAMRTGKVLEEVEYYDTELYDLAFHESWLSRTEKQWQLITDREKATKSYNPSKRAKPVKSNDPKTSPNSNGKLRQDVQKIDPNGNTDPDTPRHMTCYELVDEKEIIECLSRILHLHVKLDNVKIDSFLEMAGIHKYTSVSNVTQETFRLRDIYTVIITTDGVSTRRSALISLYVEIDNVTQGFQRIEQLASELDLQPQQIYKT
ncbi:uncharacterized protein [Engystomops pustulosus]|uniref:uncharacterized protein n=1 Tax=Engystomops pustulosus TaxID=76066 RepID=UPI003AFA0EAF